MKLLVLSDSHGRADYVRALLEMHADAAGLIFCGDGLRDLPDDPGMPVYAVRGNCDVFTMFDLDPSPEEQTACIGGCRIAVLHGHTRRAKAGYGRLMGLGIERDADIVCFGHTHEQVEHCVPAGEVLFGRTLERPLYLFNPGALNVGRFGLITLQNGQILLSHGRL